MFEHIVYRELGIIQTCLWISIAYFTCGEVEFLKQCNCKVDLQRLTADCSELGLTNVSDIFSCVPNNTIELNLSNNNIGEISPGTFARFSSLQTLTLSRNKIKFLESGVFNGLMQLKLLSLDYNYLNKNASYADDLFKPLRSLLQLYLQGNCDVHTSVCYYPDIALSSATSLRYLHLDGLPNTEFSEGFAKLSNLKALYLDGENGYCDMPVLTENTFKQFKQTPLSHLHLEGCDVIKVAPNVFRSLVNLTTLVITDNRYLCSDGIENATIGLNETNIEMIRFNYWCRTPSTYISLTENMLKGLTNTSLKTLDLGWNRIIYIDPKCVENLPVTLRYISLKENRIDSAHFLDHLRRLDILEIFDGSYQYNNNIDDSVFTNEDNNMNVKISDMLENLNDHKNDDKIYLPRNLTTIYMNNIKLGYPVPSVTFGPNKLKYLDSSSCLLKAFLGPWLGLTELQFFNLSNNRFTYFSPRALVDMGNLRTLLLQNNQIGPSLNRDNDCQTFSSQEKLEELDLSNSAIKELPYKIFYNLTNLKTLNLANNSIRNVNFLLRRMSHIQKLDLSYNVIEYISRENMDALDHIASKREVELVLTGNVLLCVCNNQDFIKWLAKTKVNVVQKDKLHCLYINKTVISLSALDILPEQLMYECTSWIVLTSCVGGFVGLLLVFSVIALLYYKRWQLRYLWYIGRVKIDPYHHPDDQGQPLLQIDAYISYEQHFDITNDVTLHRTITEHVYPFFENRGYKLTIREEFAGNEKLYSVIPKTIRKSRKVIALLTPSYCKDYWNTFEFNLAAYQGIYSKRNVILPVIIGDISNIDMTSEIRSFIRTKIKSKEVLWYPLPGNFYRNINSFNEQLEDWLRR
ncbi:toll-like receptor 4 [Ruditapes philippinarum]|uniref:toll-like receptor 4 n=1 Tax=Ruditapes philippinarum TaxID=129788 RepID=UPI00295BAE86|nr:toll-like receptor 4 [Ruditapes philippinarum]